MLLHDSFNGWYSMILKHKLHDGASQNRKLKPIVKRPLFNGLNTSSFHDGGNSG